LLFALSISGGPDVAAVLISRGFSPVISGFDCKWC